MEWTVLPHPPYSPELAPSVFHLFGPLKDALGGRRFVDDNVREELRRFSNEFYATGIQRLTQRWKKCVENEGDFVEKKSQLCKGCTHDIRKFHYN
jgi:histone-lysine N-methyltransferase SETMAR